MFAHDASLPLSVSGLSFIFNLTVQDTIISISIYHEGFTKAQPNCTDKGLMNSVVIDDYF